MSIRYDEKSLKRIADNLQNYLELIDDYVIIEGISQREYDEAVRLVKKLIKKLKKGKGDDVFNQERLADYVSHGEFKFGDI